LRTGGEHSTTRPPPLKMLKRLLRKFILWHTSRKLKIKNYIIYIQITRVKIKKQIFYNKLAYITGKVYIFSLSNGIVHSLKKL